MRGFTREKGRLIPHSLCERCIHAVPSATTGCEWSEYGQPIDGWVVFQFDDPELDAYRNRVLLCPKYMAEGREELEGTFKVFHELGTAIVAQAVVDYRYALEKWERNKSKYMEALDRQAEMAELAIYKNELWQKYRKQQRSGIPALIRNTWSRMKKEREEWTQVYREAVSINSEIESCERFFRSDILDLYTDLSGDFIIRHITHQVREEQSWKLNRKTTKGFTYRGTNTSSETVNATGS